MYKKRSKSTPVNQNKLIKVLQFFFGLRCPLKQTVKYRFFINNLKSFYNDLLNQLIHHLII